MSYFLVICKQHSQASEMYSFCLIINEQTPYIKMNAPNTVATIEVVCSMSMYYQCLKGKKKKKRKCVAREKVEQWWQWWKKRDLSQRKLIYIEWIIKSNDLTHPLNLYCNFLYLSVSEIHACTIIEAFFIHIFTREKESAITQCNRSRNNNRRINTEFRPFCCCVIWKMPYAIINTNIYSGRTKVSSLVTGLW